MKFFLPRQSPERQTFGVFVIVPYQERRIGLGCGRAGPQMDDALGLVQAPGFEFLQKIVGLQIIAEAFAAKVFPLLGGFQAIDDQKVFKAFLIKPGQQHTADKTGPAGDDPHDGPCFIIFPSFRPEGPSRPNNICLKSLNVYLYY